MPPGGRRGCALALAARDTHLDLVRRTQPAITQFEVDGHRDRVLYPVAAPRGADTALHRPQRLAVRVPGFHPGVDEALPDLRQLFNAGAEQVDALTAGDFGVEAEIPGDFGDHHQLLRGDFTTGQPRHH